MLFKKKYFQIKKKVLPWIFKIRGTVYSVKMLLTSMIHPICRFNPLTCLLYKCTVFFFFRYHKKGNPEDGHMQYIINNLLPPHGFTIGHIIYYFSRNGSRREDVLSEIREFHTNCLFCDKYLNPSTTCSI